MQYQNTFSASPEVVRRVLVLPLIDILPEEACLVHLEVLLTFSLSMCLCLLEVHHWDALAWRAGPCLSTEDFLLHLLSEGTLRHRAISVLVPAVEASLDLACPLGASSRPICGTKYVL